MKPLTSAALLVAMFSLSAPAPGGAQTTPRPMTVEAVTVKAISIDVTGVPQGGTGTSTLTFSPMYYGNEAGAKVAALDRCHRSLLLALAKPGQYVATISSESCTVALVAP